MSAGARTRPTLVTGWAWHLDTDEITFSGRPARLFDDDRPTTMAALLARAAANDRERLDEAMRWVRSNGEPFEVVGRFDDPDGGGSVVVELRASPAPTPADGPVVMVGTVTDRSRADEALLINDTVVQRLSVASMALNNGDLRATGQALGQTLVAARELMTNLVEPGTPTRPGRPDAAVPVEATAPRTGAAAATGPVRAVIADDTAEIRTGLRSLLTAGSDIEVVGEAADGAEAVATVAALDPDLVLLDLSMPVMDGLEALAVIRRDNPRAKVVVLSGYGREQAAAQALSAGAVAYIEKGGSTRGLLELLQAQFPDRVQLGRQSRPAAPGEPSAAGAAGPDAPSTTQTDLLDVAIHEMRTPLLALSALLTALRPDAGSSLPPPTAELVDSAAHQARRLTHVVTTLSDAHVIGMDDLGQVTEIVPVADLVTKVVEESRFLIGPHPVSVVIEAEGGSSLVAADGRRVRQAVEALVSNAARFSPDDAPIEITVRSDATSVEVVVRDRGGGIPVWRAPELFGRFSRLHATSGLGLGLFLTRRIARAYGGEVRLEATGPDGSTMVLRLPRLIGAGA